MKIIVSALMATILIATGCKSGGGGDPKVVLMNFFDAMAKKDFTAIKKYTTKESESMMGMMQMGMQNMEINQASYSIIKSKILNLEQLLSRAIRQQSRLRTKNQEK